MVNVHLTVAGAQTAIGTFALFYFDTENGDLVKQSVERAKGTDEPAEQPEDEYAANHNADQQQEFPCEQRSKHGEVAGVYLVGQKTDAALQSTCRAYVFTERGQGGIPEGIHDRNDKNEENQNCILEKAQQPCDWAFLQFRGFDLVEQFLNQTEGAQPTADHSAEHDGIQQQNAAYIIDCAVVCAEGALQGT